MRRVAALLAAASARAQAPAPAAAPAQAPAPAVAAEPAPPAKLAALILAADPADAQLALDLTEVLIAALARRGGLEIAGAEEFRARLGVEDQRAALACLDNAACLGRAGVALGVTSVVAGSVGKRGGDYLFSLSLVDISTGKVQGRAFTLVTGGIPALVETIRNEAGRVLEPRPEPGAVRVQAAAGSAQVYVDDVFSGSTPVRRDGLEPGKHRLRVEKEGHHGWAKEVDVPAGSVLEIKLSLASLPARRRWPAYVAWGGLAAAVVAGATGVFFGALSEQSPTSATRAGYADELDAKQAQAATANVLFAAAGGFALASGLTFWIWSDDVFGRQARPGP